MIGAILSWLTGGGIAAIGKELRAAYQAKLSAQTEREKLDADLTIRELEARQAVLIAEQGSGLTRWIRPAFAAPFALYIWKVVVWDKIFGWGVTDPLSPELGQIMMVVLGAYFLTRPIEKWVRR